MSDEIHREPPLADVPLLQGPLSSYFITTPLHGIPLLGLPGSICLERRDVLRVRPVGSMDHLLQEFKRHAVGGLSLLRIIRSPRWRESRQMLVWALDLAHTHRGPIARLPWWEDADCAVWALQAFQPYSGH